jgi:hypothetical protein
MLLVPWLYPGVVSLLRRASAVALAGPWAVFLGPRVGLM